MKCKKNYVITTTSQKYVICYECQKDLLIGEIKDPMFKKLFDIPEDYYKTNAFLRNIKINYLRYYSLTENQISAFKKTVEKMKEISK
jgi:hypothetical protein